MKGIGLGENLLQITATPGQGQEQPWAGREVVLMLDLLPSRELCFLICPVTQILCGPCRDDLHTPPEVPPSLCWEEFDSTEETKHQTRVQHG